MYMYIDWNVAPECRKRKRNRKNKMKKKQWLLKFVKLMWAKNHDLK